MPGVKSFCLAVLLLSVACCLAFAVNQQEPSSPDAVAEELVNTLRKGLISHSPEQMLSAFDADKMAGYNIFADQVRALFNQYDSFRVYAHILQSSVQDGRGIATVEFEMEETPHDPSIPPVRKRAQLRLQMERNTIGWKIVNFNPRNFFS